MNKPAIDYSMFGDVKTPDGVVVHLTQHPYACKYGIELGVVYRAHGEDDAGNEYRITWQTTLAWDNAQADAKLDREYDDTLDESKACDWDDYEIEAL